MSSLRLSEWLYIDNVPTAVTATMVGSQRSSLVALDIMAPSVGTAGPNTAALPALTRLTCLDVRPYPHQTHCVPRWHHVTFVAFVLWTLRV